MAHRTPPVLIALIVCASCAQGPELPGTLSAADRAAPFPDLVPIATLLDGPDGTTRITASSIANFETRIARLRNRAAQLRGPVVDPTTRNEMRAAIDRAALR